jgi:hypothetical protein
MMTEPNEVKQTECELVLETKIKKPRKQRVTKSVATVAKIVKKSKKPVSVPETVDEVASEPEETPEPPAPADKPLKVKRTRAPSAYNVYVKEMMGSEKIKGLPHKERFKAISAMWKEQKEKK